VTAIYTGLVILLIVRALLKLQCSHPCDIQAYQSTKDDNASYNALVDILESIDHFLNRLDVYTRIPPTAAMNKMVFKILVELLSILALATKQFKQGRFSESVFA
jgi:hypothetical protein